MSLALRLLGREPKEHITFEAREDRRVVQPLVQAQVELVTRDQVGNDARALRTADQTEILDGPAKLFAGAPKLLWFRTDGVCLTIDAAEGERTRTLFARLDAVAREHGALVNLSKDSRVCAETVRAVYPGYDECRRRLRDFDPERRFDSMLRRRIGV